MTKSIAHRNGMNWAGNAAFQDGLVDWRDATPPDMASGDARFTTGRLRSCGYCGSMHPADLAAALAAGAKADWADWKYGWPHKLYVEGIPNPHAGMLESRLMTSDAVPKCPKTGVACEHGKQSFRWDPKCECMQRAEPTEGFYGETRMVRMQHGFRNDTGKPEFLWHAAGEPAKATTSGKFYTVHLKDASPEERRVIEKAMGLHFDFEDDGRVGWWPFGSKRPEKV